MMDQKSKEIFLGRLKEIGQLTVLTGAGISAESGIPTFRGPEGYWTIGSESYHPQEMATWAMFSRHPQEVWKWYLHRKAVCNNATPNKGHLAVVEMERCLGNRFKLITQNVDGLHLRAGSSIDAIYQIHGNIDYMRCSVSCSDSIYSIPETALQKPMSAEVSRLLVCPECGELTRPHVLWFDESYDEKYFRFESSLDIATKTDILIIVGTTGATTLPNHIAGTVAKRNGLIIDINIEKNIFSDLAEQHGGVSIRGPSGEALSELADIINCA